MTDKELIASLKDEVASVKTNLENEAKAHAETKASLETANTNIATLEGEIVEKDKLIEALAAAPATSEAAASTSAGLEFKHDSKLYKLGEAPDRKLLIPSFGELTAAEAVANEDVAAYFVKAGIAEEIG